MMFFFVFFFQAEDGIGYYGVTGVQTCALPISEFDPQTGAKVDSLDSIRVYANSHHVTPGPTLKQAMEAIKHELAERLKELHAEGKLLEAQRLEQRTNFDLEMIAATGS